MLKDHAAIATIAVKDLAAARRFYGDVLGLPEDAGSDNPEVAMYSSGGTNLLVYRSQYAGTNVATAATWAVADDLETIVDRLGAAGVTFEHYDVPQLTRAGDVHVAADGFKVAWFKDPDGNVLSILRRPG